MALTPFEQATLFLGAGLYGLALLWSIGHFASSRIFRPFQGRAIILAAFLAHTVLLVTRGIRVGQLSVVSLPETLVFLTWCITFIYMAVDRSFDIPSLPAFLMPVNVLLFAGAAASLPRAEQVIPAHVCEYALYVHIVGALLSYGAFVLAAALSVMYLLQERQLKRKHAGVLFRRLPSLEVCDRTAQRALGIGFVLLTVSLAIGAISAASTGALGPEWASQPKVVLASITWLAYAVLVPLRATSTLIGRKRVYFTILAFCLVLLTFLGTPLILGEVHG